MTIKEHLRGLRKHSNIFAIVFVFCMMASFSFLAMRGMKTTSAASIAGFKPGNIMSDAVMANYNSMSVSDIQNFLNSKNRCGNTNYNLYKSLKASYPNTDWHWKDGHFVCISEERFGDGITVGSGQTAAEIIYQAAHDYRINPQVLLVLLQKEQGLITDDYPNSRQYRSATGFGCPDTAACDSQYYGFKNQVRRAANLFRTVLDGGWSNYPAGQTLYVQYNPNRDCGGTNVYIENRATSALYRYTPYQPNASALSAGYGTGDSCGAYGNRNFYLYFNDWFGSPQINIQGEVVNIPEGEYAFTSGVSGAYSFGIANGGGNGTNVQLINHDQNGIAQKWRVQKTSDGFYQLIHSSTGRALDVAGADHIRDGSNLQLWDRNDTCGQKWRIYSTGNGNLTFESACMGGMTVDLSGGTAQSGNNIQVWITNGSNVQKWNLRVGKLIDDGIYTMQSKVNTNRVSDIAGGNNRNGTNIILWDSLGAENQRWQFAYDNATDTYSIINPANHKALDVAGGTAVRNGSNVQLWDYNGSCVQRWKIIPREDNGYSLLNACSPGYALDVQGGNNNNGTNIQLWSNHDEPPEQWELRRNI